MAKLLQIGVLRFGRGIPIVGMSALMGQSQALQKVVDTRFVRHAVACADEGFHPLGSPDIALNAMVARTRGEQECFEFLFLHVAQEPRLLTGIGLHQAGKAAFDVELDIFAAGGDAFTDHGWQDINVMSLGKGFDASQACAQILGLTTMMDAFVLVIVEASGKKELTSMGHGSCDS
jgi:hypothetical protein